MKNKFISINEKLIVSYLLILILLAWVALYSLYTINRISNEYNHFIEDISMLNNIKSSITSSKIALDNLLLTRSTNYIDTIYSSINSASFAIKDFKNENPPIEVFNACTDLQKLLSNYEKYCEGTFRVALSTADERYIRNYNNALKVYNYILEGLDEINNHIYENRFKNYSLILQHNSNFSKTILFIFALSIFLSILFVFIFSSKLIKNIKKITKNALEISKGNFKVENIQVHSQDEISILSNTFNLMVEKIKNLMREVKRKTELEKEAQFLALQSQINPHFLFNTLNVIAKTSILEGADETCDLIESLSDFLRYTLRNPSSQVKLLDEIEYLREYISIQKTRFSDRVQFIENIDENLLNYKIPLLSLQPIVENAFKHGLEGKEEGGKIVFTLTEKGNYILIKIEDNGKGFSHDYHIKSKPSSSIGLHNVIERLKLFYKNKGLLFFYNQSSGGAMIKIIIPKVE
ncbi:sensor histidine kinase [Crassaminicella profunda]|uniref:sensor histidine kinase n=1 Tax=Crassaminicella profunda TaxID=1286698 RepID=UPI001CA6F83F|nr:histidine kinase [Crassaminicella profunda]QZY55645.1 histidine kinase [Crassaminicella profunda]